MGDMADMINDLSPDPIQAHIPGLSRITLDPPDVVNMDVALDAAFAELGLATMGGASGYGWSRYRDLQLCPHKFWRKHVDPKRHKAEETRHPSALQLGSAFHAFMAIYYQRQIDLLAGKPPAPMAGELCDLTIANGGDPVLVNEAWRLFESYANYYETRSDYLIPLAVEHLAKDRNGPSTCRYDLIAKVEDNAKILPGTYIVEHKCLVGAAEIIDQWRGRLTLEDCFATEYEPTLLAWDGERDLNQLVYAPAQIRPNCVRETYRVRLASGRYVDASDNHPFLTSRGWVPAASITTNDWVAVPVATASSAHEPVWLNDEVEFVGLMLGDGSATKKISFCKSGPTMDRFKACCDRLGWTYRADDHAPQVALSQAIGAGPRDLLEKCGLYGHAAATKFVPRVLLGTSKEQAMLLLGALWDTDGCIDVFREERADKNLQWKVRIAYTSRSEQLCRDVQTLLLQLGVQSTVRQSSVEYNGGRVPYWTTKVVTRVCKRRFLKHVLETEIWISKYTAEHVRDAYDKIKPGDDRPIPTALLRHRDDLTGVERNKLLGNRQSVWASTLIDVLDKRAVEIVKLPVHWERVESVLAAGRQMTYDVTVPGVHTFVANDIITHNTTSRMDRSVTEGWHLDGEIVGETMLWYKANLARTYGPLQGIIVNIVTKTKVVNFHREIVSLPKAQLRRQYSDLKVWRAMEEVYRATNKWPRALAACWGRYGACEFFDECRDL